MKGERAAIPTPPPVPRILIIDAPYYADLAAELLAGATAVLDEAGAEWERISVPGVLEIPAALEMAVEAGRHDGYVLLGVVIRGETAHFDIVAFESTRAITDQTVRHRLALGNGIQTTENEAQAWARARASEKDKGGGAARAALAMIEVRERLHG